MSKTVLNIMIGGAAGQGLVTIGEILAKALVRSGYSVVVRQDYMSRVRGGHNTYRVRAGTGEVFSSAEKFDVLFAMNRESVDLHVAELADNPCVIMDAAFAQAGDTGLQAPFAELAEEKTLNVAGLGVLSCILDLEEKVCLQAILDHFGKKGESVKEQNEAAFKKAAAWTRNQPNIAYKKLPRVESPAKRLMLSGNQAIALGAMTAGVKFYAFYPMSPSTSIGQFLAAQMNKLPLVVEQAEDEIAAINMALGASYAGVPAMVGTSGGGFALMVEGLSLAAVSETPIVIAIAQRPGPATGIATRTEQADLLFALFTAHGEFPRAIFAPGNVEQCFHLTHRAFEIAEQTQSPVIVLTDQFLADSFRSVSPFDLDAMQPVIPGEGVEVREGTYQRYQFTASGVSPRLVPGKSENLVVADSHEHTEDGHISEDKANRVKMADKRWRKLELMKAAAVPPDYYGPDNPDLVLVSWGSTLGAAREAAEILGGAGKKAGALHFSQVWPLVPENFAARLQGVKEIVAVEGNSSAQFAQLLKLEADIKVTRKVLRYDGRPLTPEFIVRELDK